MNKLQIAVTFALVFSITSLIVTIAAAHAESDGDGLCSHYFRTGYQEAGEKCLEEQERAKEKKECEKDGKKDC